LATFITLRIIITTKNFFLVFGTFDNPNDAADLEMELVASADGCVW